ncbi:DNA replication/repair protein RecF [Thiolapillus sp.]
MKIDHIQIENLRIIRNMTLAPGAGLNFIHGDNGAGKTSVLEAIFLLGQGKSFRHSDAGPLIRQGREQTQVVADLQTSTGIASRLGIQRSTRAFVARHGGQDVSRRSELMRLLPLQLITPQSHELIERGPELRRRYLDYGLFHVEQPYHQVLLSYHRTLKQRNAALRSGDILLARSFNEQLISFSRVILKSRQELLAKIEAQLAIFVEATAFPVSIALRLSKGWKTGLELNEALEKAERQDLSRGFTSVGVHRGQLKVLAAGVAADKTLSRGQQKLLIYGLVLSLSRLILEKTNEPPLLLIDDLGAELDNVNSQRILDFLERTGMQTFITVLDARRYQLPDSAKLFHVKHGVI